MTGSLLATSIDTVRRMESRRVAGSVAALRGLTLLVDDLPLPVGSLVRLRSARHRPARGDAPTWGEIIGFDGARAIVMLYGGADGVAPGTEVIGEQTAQTVGVGMSLLGRVLDGMGRPIDGGGPPIDTVQCPLHPRPVCALDRRRIEEPLPTGVRVIDGMLTLGRGQRIGVFAGPGVGKSTLLASIARNTAADVSVIALVGERGREAGEFLEETLGADGLARSVVVVATGDESPLLRIRAALVATTIAEHFRRLGRDVMLLMDSLTRFAQAQRQIGLAACEQPATKGYTPSVFAMLPILLERAGSIRDEGSITGIYTVLVEGDDHTEPISDAARGILDGHIALARRIASRGHFPAVDVLDSVSRVADSVCDPAHRTSRRLLRRIMAAYAESEELINIGAYTGGTNVACDDMIRLKPEVDALLTQPPDQPSPYPETCRRLIKLAEKITALPGDA